FALSLFPLFLFGWVRLFCTLPALAWLDADDTFLEGRVCESFQRSLFLAEEMISSQLPLALSELTASTYRLTLALNSELLRHLDTVPGFTSTIRASSRVRTAGICATMDAACS